MTTVTRLRGSFVAPLTALSRNRPNVVHCVHGDRVASAVSILERAGFSPLRNVDGSDDVFRTIAAADGAPR